MKRRTAVGDNLTEAVQVLPSSLLCSEEHTSPGLKSLGHRFQALGVYLRLDN